MKCTESWFISITLGSAIILQGSLRKAVHEASSSLCPQELAARGDLAIGPEETPCSLGWGCSWQTSRRDSDKHQSKCTILYFNVVKKPEQREQWRAAAPSSALLSPRRNKPGKKKKKKTHGWFCFTSVIYFLKDNQLRHIQALERFELSGTSLSSSATSSAGLREPNTTSTKTLISENWRAKWVCISY